MSTAKLLKRARALDKKRVNKRPKKRRKAVTSTRLHLNHVMSAHHVNQSVKKSLGKKYTIKSVMKGRISAMHHIILYVDNIVADASKMITDANNMLQQTQRTKRNASTVTSSMMTLICLTLYNKYSPFEDFDAETFGTDLDTFSHNYTKTVDALKKMNITASQKQVMLSNAMPRKVFVPHSKVRTHLKHLTKMRVGVIPALKLSYLIQLCLNSLFADIKENMPSKGPYNIKPEYVDNWIVTHMSNRQNYCRMDVQPKKGKQKLKLTGNEVNKNAKDRTPLSPRNLKVTHYKKKMKAKKRR
jgi:hypothetical protein